MILAVCVIASMYWQGQMTASGERFKPMGMTAAMWDVPLNSRFEVEYGGRKVIVRINDRGPARRLKRGIDLSLGAARALKFPGLGRVCIRRVG